MNDLAKRMRATAARRGGDVLLDEYASELEAHLAQRGEAVANSPIADLMAQYAAEDSDLANPDWVRRTAQRYVETMPDSQVRCLLHALSTTPSPDAPVEDECGACPYCGVAFQLVRPGKCQPNCACQDAPTAPDAMFASDVGPTASTHGFARPSESEEAAKYCEELARSFFTPSGGPYFKDSEHDAALLRLAATALRTGVTEWTDKQVVAARERFNLGMACGEAQATAMRAALTAAVGVKS